MKIRQVEGISNFGADDGMRLALQHALLTRKHARIFRLKAVHRTVFFTPKARFGFKSRYLLLSLLLKTREEHFRTPLCLGADDGTRLASQYALLTCKHARIFRLKTVHRTVFFTPKARFGFKSHYLLLSLLLKNKRGVLSYSSLPWCG